MCDLCDLGSACEFETVTVYEDDGTDCGTTYTNTWISLEYCVKTGSSTSSRNECWSSYFSGVNTYNMFATDDCTEAPTAPTTPWPTNTPYPTPAPVPTTPYPTTLDCTEYAVCDGSGSDSSAVKASIAAAFLVVLAYTAAM